MKIVVVGGKLQGIEVAYLAREAGWKVILVDKDPCTPATGFCDEFFQLDVNSEGEKIVQIARGADLIIPALKDRKTLDQLVDLMCRCGSPMFFDQFSYSITSSRRKSESIFLNNEFPAPRHWPQCSLPAIVRISNLRGKRIIKYVLRPSDLNEFLAKDQIKGEDWVIQEYLEGDYYSLEVIGCQGIYRIIQITDLDMDRNFDHKRVSASTRLTNELQKQFCSLAERICGMINLEGIINIEVINHQGTIKVLEINAHLPSLTPIVVYKSTKMNMLTLLDSVYRRGIFDTVLTQETRAVVSEYIRATPKMLEIAGEHMMSNAGPVSLLYDFFGAEEAITNYRPGQKYWVARLIHTGVDLAEVELKRIKVLENIQKHLRIPCLMDSVPKISLGDYLENKVCNNS